MDTIAEQNQRRKVGFTKRLRRVYPDANGYKLGDLVAALNLPKGDAHRALSDAVMTAHLVSAMHDRLLNETGGQFLLSADNLLRISKVAPKQFRDNGIQKAYLTAKKKKSHLKYESYDFIGEKFNITKKPAKVVKQPKKRLLTQPRNTIVPPKTTTSPTVEKAKREVSPLPRAKKGGIVGFLRKTLKVINGIFFGTFLLVGLYALFTEPDKIFSFILLVIIYAIAYFINSMVDKLLS